MRSQREIGQARDRCELALRLLDLGDLSRTDAARRLGVGVGLVRRTRSEFGLPGPERRLSVEGRELAAERIRARMAELAVAKPVPRPSGPRPLDPQQARHAERRAQLAEQLRGMGHLTAERAAEQLGCSDQLVRKIRREHGMPAPPRPRMGAAQREAIAQAQRQRWQERAAARVAPVVRRAEVAGPSPKQVAEVEAKIARGERVARWSCSLCGMAVRWPSWPPSGWWGSPPVTAPQCPSCHADYVEERARNAYHPNRKETTR